MKLAPPDPPLDLVKQAAVCEQCHSVARLANGLCLNCLLHGALDDADIPLEQEAFKAMLAAIKSREGDWHIADHEILDEISRGGMGVVYLAKEPHSERIVALKCIPAYQGHTDDTVLRFRREAETAALLDHPNIVPIYRVGETADGVPYYTMKYTPAGSLLKAQAYLFRHPRQSVELMIKVARAVHYAHGKGVLHRDLKPGNILVDNRGEPLVSDFGMARCDATANYLTRSVSSFGTPGYVAPEQADGPSSRLTPAADVYSLGAMLFELLTGRPPFVGDNALAVMKRSAQHAAPKARTLSQNVDRDLETICACCLEREPADRYQSAHLVADDLQNWLDDRPILARPVKMWVRAFRWSRHNRLLASSLVALFVLGTGSLVWLLRTQRIQAAMEEKILGARSVVVLPFLDLDTAEAAPGTTQWVARSLRRQLEVLGSVRVSTGTVLGWGKLEDIHNAAQGARGRTVLTGTVRMVGGQRRISLRLLDPASGQTLFGKLLEQQAEAPSSARAGEKWGRNIYQILSADDWSGVVNSRRDPGLRNEIASEALKSGRSWMSSYTVSDLDQAIALFNKAIAVEPASSLAHSYLAMAVTGRTHFVSDPTYLEQGRSEALKALALDPNSVDAHRALAGVYYQEGQFDEALEEQMQTIEIGGVEEKITTFLGMTLDALGSPDRALRWYGICSKLQAQPGDVESSIGDSWARLGDDEQAFRAYDRAIELQPGTSQGAVGKCHVHLLRGEFEQAREICRIRFRSSNELGEMSKIAAQIEFFARNYAAAEELYSKLAQSDPYGGGSFYGAITYQSALGRIKQALGSSEIANTLLQEALERERAALIRQPGNSEAAYRLAAVEASLNLSDAALQHLHQAAASGWLDYRSLQRDPRFDSLRSNPELVTLIDGIAARGAEKKRKAKAK